MDNRSSRRSFNVKLEWDILNQFLKDHPLPKEPFFGYDPGGPDQGATHPNCKCGGIRFVRDVVLVGGQSNGQHTLVEIGHDHLAVPHIPEIRCLPDNSLMIETTFVDVYEQYAEVCTGNWNNPDDIVAIFKYKNENRRPK